MCIDRNLCCFKRVLLTYSPIGNYAEISGIVGLNLTSRPLKKLRKTHTHQFSSGCDFTLLVVSDVFS